MALFVGNPDDIVPERLGPQLPAIRDWTERHFDFTGYVTGLTPLTSAIAPGCVPSWATATTSGSASSRSAARASGRTCCDESSRLFRRPSKGSRTCA